MCSSKILTDQSFIPKIGKRDIIKLISIILMIYKTVKKIESQNSRQK